MIKQRINVPKGIHYLSQLKDFELPNGVLNKEITGCGATTIALTDKHPTIICSPRNELLKNKKAQYPNSFLVNQGVSSEDIKKYLDKTNLPKILITYDSFPKILDAIENKQDWKVVIDEFHYILSDACFKSEVSLKLLDEIKQFPYVTYLSATPILDEFLSELNYFKNIPYYQMNWLDKDNIDLIRIKTNKPLNCIICIIEQYKKGNYPQIQIDNDRIIDSKESVVFLNSVTDIINIINKCNISADEVNIIVANSEDNKVLISKLGKDYKKGSIPLKGEPHKKFTFCTSTAYAGCDFYSECASTFVVSNCKKLNTSIDISTDLIQIAGRQRLNTNPFRKKIHFIYNTDIEDILKNNLFEQNINNKIKMTYKEIALYNNVEEDFKRVQGIKNKRTPHSLKYEFSYTMYDEVKNEFVFNKLAQLNEIYSYKIQKYNYKNGIIVKEQLEESGFQITSPQKWKLYEEQIKQMIRKGTFVEKMQEYCEMKKKNDIASKAIARSIEQANSTLKYYYDELGYQKIKSLNYKKANLNREIESKKNHDLIGEKLQDYLKEKQIISAQETKSIIKQIYSELNISKNAKGSDLTHWYNIKTDTIMINGAKTRVYKIISKK